MRLTGLVALLGLAISPLEANCAPDRMVKVVYRNVTPGVARGSFAAAPRTLYRLGTRYMRLEEAPDPENRIHGLIVTNEPDSWMANLMTSKGKHIVDSGPTFNAHAPVLWAEELPSFFKELEFGCEMGFVKQRALSSPETTEVEGEKILRYRVVEGSYKISVHIGKKDKKPRAIVLLKGADVLYAVRYDVYETGLEPQLGLFERPQDIEYDESP